MSFFPSGRRRGRKQNRSLRKPNKVKRNNRRSAPLSIESLEERMLMAADVVYRINAGGPAVQDWLADTTNNPSQYANVEAAVAKTNSTVATIDMTHASIPTGTPQALFKTERWDTPQGEELQWNLPVTAGQYEVRLYFAEFYSGNFEVGGRVFDVSIEGQLKLNDYDIFADVGAKKAVMKSFVVTADSNLDIDFGHVTENPAIKAIEIIRLDSGSNLAPVLAPIANQTVTAGQSKSVNISASDPNGNAIDLNASNLPAWATFVDNGNGTASLVLAPGASVSGTFNLSVSATDNGSPALSDQQTFSVTVGSSNPGTPGEVVYRINAGGPVLGDWAADTATKPSIYLNAAVAKAKVKTTNVTVDMSHASIPAGMSADIFKTERWDSALGQEMQWNLPVAAGQYEVRLYFAETYTGAQKIGGRLFDVLIEGQVVLDNYDVFAEVGANKAVMKKFTVSTDGNLDIDFGHVADHPSIKAIEIVRVGSAANQLSPSASSLSFAGVLVGNTVSQTLTLTNLGSAGDPSITVSPANLQIVGSGANKFSVSIAGQSSVTLAPGQSVNLTVQFSPTDATAKSATLQISHSGSNSPLSLQLSGTAVTSVPIGFGKSTLEGETSSQPTSLQFGPDGRLYVAQQDGLIKIYTIVRTGANNYDVTATETITSIQQIANHDDNGSLNTSVNTRLVTGLLVTGTAANPVIYVTSSDPRIGAGTSGDDLNLDTNSGILSRLTWSGSAWVKVDLVRGLPRSEENHASNGMALNTSTNTLYIGQGGNTNMGAPSNNFAQLPEYALSAAILSVDLNAIGNSTYNIPTLNDEDRPGTSDANDPFGGNDGKNQARLVPGGPVQVYAPGFRNPYDLVLTADGRLYTIDNGPNAGWGDVPVGEGPEGEATNDSHGGGPTYGDGLHLITGPGYYGGHPNPTRSNPDNTFNDSIPQSPVSLANPIESDYLIPGVENGAMVVYGSSTNGLTQYMASNFQGSLKGDLLAASLDNKIKRVKLDADGDTVLLQETLFNSVGAAPLDVTTLGDDGIFPGTIWVADIANGKIFVYEPNDFGGAPNPDPGNENDTDGDGYTNEDELANGTNPDSAGDVPADFDQDFVSNLLDENDDNDALWDNEDPFAIDSTNGMTTQIGTSYVWENDAPNPGGLLNLGFTGLMSNGTADYATLFDPLQLTSGGAAGVLTLDAIGEGDATGATNTQQQAFQFGVNVANATTPFVAHTRIVDPFADATPQGQQSMGMYIGTGNQDNYFKIVVTANNGNPAITYVKEVNGVVTTGPLVTLSLAGVDAIDLYLTINPVNNTVQASYDVTTASGQSQRVNVGAAVSIPASWLPDTIGMAVGIISTSVGSAPPITATWDFLEVVSAQPGNAAPVLAPITNQTVTAGQSKTVAISATDPNGNAIDLNVTGLPAWATFVDNNNGTGSLVLAPGASVTGTFNLTISATDNGSPAMSSQQMITVTVNAASSGGEVVYRINAGGPAVQDWAANTTNNPSSYANSEDAVAKTNSTAATIDMTHASIPTGTPQALFKTERWDTPQGEELQWNLPVTAGQYEVRLYFAEFYSGNFEVGGRVFDVSIEGQLKLNDYDVFADVGAKKAVMKSFVVTVDGNLDIDFGHVTDNPAIKAIEVIRVGSSSNAAPVLATIANQTMTAGESKTVAISATDANGNAIDLNVSGLPAWATFVDNGNGTGSLVLAPGANVAGTFNLTVSATDNGSPALSDQQSLSITVNPIPPQSGGTVVHQVNAGGGSVDDWDADSVTGPLSPDAIDEAVAVGNQLEMFIDDYLIDTLTGAALEMHQAIQAAASASPHAVGQFPSIIFDGTLYHHYYRDLVSGANPSGADGTNLEVYRYEYSTDGINWIKPNLNLYNVSVDGPNNVVLANYAPSMHNFMPFLDTNPNVSPQHKFKAIAGVSHIGSTVAPISGIRVFSSPDGIHWSLYSPNPVVTIADMPETKDKYGFDSANVAFWSELEQKYVMYYRTWSTGTTSGVREISRAVSTDFINWTDHVDVTANLSGEHLYTSAINPYFNAPQIYVGIPTQFLPNNTAHNTRIMFMTSRDGLTFDRTFGNEALVEGLDGNRQNYAAPVIVQTGDDEMSIYSQSGLRYTMRLDGFSSIDTTGTSGEMITKPLVFSGDRLELNFTTGSGGSVRVELLDEAGNVIPGFGLASSELLSGDEVEHVVQWNGSGNLSQLAGQTIRVRFVMNNADLYSMRFDGATANVPPQLVVPQSLAAAKGATLAVPICLRSMGTNPISLTSASFAVSFDPTRFSVSNVRAAAALAGYTVNAQVDNTNGKLTISVSGPLKTLPGNALTDLVLADFTVKTTSAAGEAVINLMNSYNGTTTRLNGGALALGETPSNGGDACDGKVAVTGTYYNANASTGTTTTTAAINMGHSSIPLGTVAALFQTERYDTAQGQEMQWDFAVTAGNYLVRLYFAETYAANFGVGDRVFDVLIEGQLVLDNYDIFADVGGNTGVVKSFVVSSDSNLDIDFAHVVQNPSIRAIQILAL